MGYYKIDKENEEFIREVIDSQSLGGYITFKVLAVGKSKNIIKVKKTSAETDALANVSDCVTIIVHERVFDRLDDETRRILVEDALNLVTYDLDKGKLNVLAPQVNVSLDGLAKYGEKLVNAAQTAVLTAQQIADEEAEEKARQKELKKSKKNA